MIRKFLKITAWVLLSLFLISGALIYSIRIPAFQTWITSRAAQYLSSQLGVNVSVGNVYILFFSKVQLKDVFIEDQSKDTLLYAGSLTSDIELFAPKHNKVYLSGITLENATVKVIKYPERPGLNFKFLLDYFSSTDTTPSKPFDFNPGEIRLKNVTFAYIDKRYNDPADGIDFEDIRLQNLQATISNFITQDDTLFADLDHLSFTEKSGFRLEYMESNIRFTPNEIEFENLLINTPHSNIQCAYKMSFEEAEDFDDYINKVRMTSTFEESTLSFQDLRYFAPELKGLEHEVQIKGKVRGTVAQLRGKQLEIRFGKNSSFKGDASLSGLPDIDETFFDLVVDELITSKTDIETIPTWPFTEGELIELPDNFGLLGNVKIDGKFTGFLNDFVAYGNASTALGFVSSDINLKIDSSTEKSSYSGELSALGFQIGKFTNSSDVLGRISFKAGIQGTGMNLNNVNAKLEGNVTELELEGYTYSSIIVNGKLRRKQFEGKLSVDEPNFAIDFAGGIDLRSQIPVYDFTTTVQRARLANLKLLNRDESSELSLAADINIRGRDLDELTGFINVHDITYSELEDTIHIQKMQFTSERGNDIQTAGFRSDLLDFDLKGKYKRSYLFDAIGQVITLYFPIFRDRTPKYIPPANLIIDVKTYDLSDVTKIFIPELFISENSTFHGELNNQTGLFKATLLTDSIRYSNIYLKGANLAAVSSEKSGMLDIDYRAESIEFNDTLEYNNINITASSGSKTAKFKVSATRFDSLNHRILVTGNAEYLPGLINVTLEPSEIVLNNTILNISENSRLSISDSNVIVKNYRLYTDSSYVEINGIISERQEDKLEITIHKFQTEILNPILGMYDFNMGGEATGTGTLSGILANPGISADIEIKNLSVFGDTLGNASFDFLYDTQNQIITVDAFADRGGIKNIEVTGNMLIGEKEDSLDFTVQLKKTNLAAFAGYAKGLVSDVRGKASGTLKLEGTLRKPLLRGQIRLQQTSFLVDFLQTRYNFSDVVHFNQRSIKFDHIKVNDVNGNQAEVYGVIRHNHLSDFVFDLEISAKNFQALNTLPKDNELFYGTAYASGKVTITGTPELTNLYMVLRTEKNTLINIPLSNPEEVSKSSFINFINVDSSLIAKKIDTETETKVTGISMTMEVDATPDAEIRLIFDQKIGDIIKGRGAGNLTMTIDPLGEFKMYGNYQVVSGDYLFTLQNLLNKKFIINSGGTIRWTGDPYDADMALEGVYKLKASLYDLFQDTSYKKRVPVEVILKLSDKLFNPTVKFDIRVPDTDPTTQTLINRYINTEQELNKQTMSLLVLNRFSKSAEVEYGGSSSSSGVSANVSEILSQQLSVWASQISDAFDVGVNYRAADQFSQEELEVALSTNLFNDRVTIDGAVNMSENNQSTSNLVGDFNVEVKVSKDGRFRFKAFNKSVENTITNNYASQYTQGIGVFYRQEFDNFSDLFKKYRSPAKKEEETTEPTQESAPEQ